MRGLAEEQLLLALLSLAVILLVARGAGELARRIGQPEVLGEFFAGFLLGPSVLGAVLPNAYHWLFLGQTTGFVLSGFSWIGAILLLLIAGIEVDLDILRAEARPGALAAFFAIVPSIVAGTLFAFLVLGRPVEYAFFLGIVLSTTAVSVAAKILIERETLRRRWAQVILAAGVSSEVLVWLMVSVVSAAHSGSVAIAVRSAVFAVGFFVLMLTIGRRLVFWAMRRVADSTHIVKGQLSLVLVLMLLSAALTQALGLHPLLGAFVLGVLLSRAPRTNRPLLDNIQTLTATLFAPIFFVLAGMRVDLPQLGSLSAIGIILLLFVVATAVKAGLGALGARLGGLSTLESALVGIGLNMKGGTDVIVAIVGLELGLFSSRTYTIYAVVATLTVFVSPVLLSYLERRVPPSGAEQDRLEREEAARRSYLPRIERVVLPMLPQLLPELAGPIVQRMAVAAQRQGLIFDVTEFTANRAKEPRDALQPAAVQAMDTLRDSRDMKNVEVVRQRVDVRHTLKPLLDASGGHDLIALGSHPVAHRTTVSFGRLQDALIQRAQTDVLLAAASADTLDLGCVRRILVPTNGQEYSMAAGDIAGYLALACDAEVVLFHAVSSEMDSLFWHEQRHQRLRNIGYGVVNELEFRIRRLGVRTASKVRIGNDAGAEIIRELDTADSGEASGGYQMVVMGGYNRTANGRPYMGGTIRNVLTSADIPALLLITQRPAR